MCIRNISERNPLCNFIKYLLWSWQTYIQICFCLGSWAQGSVEFIIIFFCNRFTFLFRKVQNQFYRDLFIVPLTYNKYRDPENFVRFLILLHIKIRIKLNLYSKYVWIIQYLHKFELVSLCAKKIKIPCIYIYI